MTWWRTIGVLAAAGWLAVSPGCITVERSGGAVASATGSPPAQDPEESDLPIMRDERGGPWSHHEAWPKRMGVWGGVRRSTVRAHGRPPMGIITETTGPLRAFRPGGVDQAQMEEELRQDVGLMAMYHGRGGSKDRFTAEGEGAGSYLFLKAKDSGAKTVWDGPAGKPAMYLKFISAQDAPASQVRGPDVEGRLVKVQRTWFAYYEATAKDGLVRGVAVVLPGMFGTPKEIVDQGVGSLRKRGWHVLRALAHPSRFTEKKAFIFGGEKGAGAAEIASELTDRAAECAYAVEAALMYLGEKKPALRALPRVAVGMSGGAMVLPTVVAREPHKYHGAVMVAGGVDYLGILLDSNYSGWIDAVSVSFAADDAKKAGEALRKAYLEAAPLDSTFCAECLRGKKLLVIHGDSDQAVPAVYGQRLWKTLGEPERWVISGGHEVLFLLLPFQLEKIGKWLDEQFAAVQPSPPSAPPAPGAAGQSPKEPSPQAPGGKP